MQPNNRARYKHWNYTTTCCFKHKGNCAECPNNLVCGQKRAYKRNEYGIHPAKYAMLMTYANSKEPYTTGFNKEELLAEGITE